MIWVLLLYVLISLGALLARAALRTQISGLALNTVSIFLSAVVVYFGAKLMTEGREIDPQLLARVVIAGFLVFVTSFIMELRERDRAG